MKPGHVLKRSTRQSGPFSAALLLTLFSAPGLRAEAPARTFAGQALQVPEEQLDQGFVYHVSPGEDAQLVAVSRANLQRLAATTSRIVGYFVAPFDLEESESPILAGAFRLPVASLLTGVDGGDERLQSEAFLDRARHPEIAFEIRSVSGVEKIKETPDETVFNLTLEGDLQVKGNTRPLTASARLRLMPFSVRAMARNVGDLAFLECEFVVRPADFGWSPPSPALRERFGEELQINVYLAFNTISPDKSGDPRDDPAIYAKQIHTLTVLRDLDDPAAGYDFVRGFMKEIWDNGPELDRLAQGIAFTEGIRTRDWWLAARLQRRASELAEDKDVGRLGALAKMHRAMGDLKTAVEWQKKAAALLEPNSPERELLGDLEKELAKRQP